ncbi:MAG TPA: hypothetical protein VLN91_02330, partial [Nitrospirota bacterium]|nr:hypothetical protein [Nitrospirota bacterium]
SSFPYLPLHFFYYCLLLSAVDIARGMPEECGLIFQEVTTCGAVFSLHEGRKILLRRGSINWESSVL